MGSTADPTSMASTSRNATASTVNRSGSYGIWAIHSLRKPSSRIWASALTVESIGEELFRLRLRLICMLTIEAPCGQIKEPRVAVGSGGQTATRSYHVYRLPAADRYKPAEYLFEAPMAPVLARPPGWPRRPD